MTTLELVSGLVHGKDSEAREMPAAGNGRSAREALEDIVRVALHHPPCVVSFSGGRDSSAVLALAAHVARRDGLPPPIPVTLRFPECPASDETEWQEAVVGHLGLVDWETPELTDEIDAVGPYAQRVLRRYGPVWPFNAHFHLPVMEHAVGGSLLTGFGGDELFGTGYVWHRVNQVLAGVSRPTPKDLVRIASAYGPRSLRTAVLRRRRNRLPRPWLREDWDQRVTEAQMHDAAAQPIAWDRSVRESWYSSRYRRIAHESRGWMARLTGVAMPINPLAEPGFLDAIAAERGRSGYRSRTHAMYELFGDLLPARVLERKTKSSFNSAFSNRHLREFAEGWDGTGLDGNAVDAGYLRDVWRGREAFDARTLSLAQMAWTATHTGDG